jgi:cytidine deaminase
MATLSGLTMQELETLSSKAIAAKANAYCMFHNKHHSSITWRETLSLPPAYGDKFWNWAGPYSKFRVGACVLTKTGEYIAGANVENVAYPVGTCAERVAFGTAVVSTWYDVSLSTWLLRVNACGCPRNFLRRAVSYGPMLYRPPDTKTSRPLQSLLISHLAHRHVVCAGNCKCYRTRPISKSMDFACTSAWFY